MNSPAVIIEQWPSYSINLHATRGSQRLRRMYRHIGLILLSLLVRTWSSSMPLPFYREIKLSDPSMTGNDVLIALTLLSRDDAVSSSYEADNSFDEDDEDATKLFQKSAGLSVTGIIDSSTAQKLLDLHSDDNYKDDGFTAASMGYKYKIHLPVKSNRSIETTATLYDADNNVLLTFPVRTHGYRDDGSHEAWPDFGDGDVGLNQFSSNGMTVTGLIEIDLNSAEPDSQV